MPASADTLWGSAQSITRRAARVSLAIAPAKVSSRLQHARERSGGAARSVLAWVLGRSSHCWLAGLGVRVVGVDPGVSQLIHAWSNGGFNGQSQQHGQHVREAQARAATKAAAEGGGGEGGGEGAAPQLPPHHPIDVDWKGHGAFGRDMKLEHCFAVGGKEYHDACGHVAYAEWVKRRAPALRKATAAACALPPCRTLDLAALRTRSACVADWLLEHGGVVYSSKAGRRWRFRKRSLKRRQFDRMAQQLTGGASSVRGARDRGVGLSARRAAVRDLREAVQVTIVFWGDSSAGHGTVIRRRFRGPVLGFRKWLAGQGARFRVWVVDIDEYRTSQSGCWRHGLQDHQFDANKGPSHKQRACQSSSPLLVVDRDTSGAINMFCKGLRAWFPSAPGGAVLDEAFAGRAL